MMSEQIISLAEVRSVVDPTRNGSFTAMVHHEGNSEISINYVSPYGTLGEGGFVAIPSVGTTVLVCKPSGSKSGWYYLGTTFDKERNQVEGEKIKDHCSPLERILPKMYRATGTPGQSTFKNAHDAGVIITDEGNSGEDSTGFITSNVEIKSSTNKRITLNDSPAVDAITIDSGNNSKITVSNSPERGDIPDSAVQIQTLGPQKYLNTGSQTDILVGEGGRELQLLNKGHGEDWGDVAGPCGNVNIQSYKKDVNIFTKADEGRIFIECLNESGNNQVIEIQTNGEGGAIRIKTKGKLDISAEFIGINATRDINMKAGGTINLHSDQDLSLRSGETVYADGNEIRLNEDGAEFADPNIGNTESYYGNDGITTY